MSSTKKTVTVTKRNDKNYNQKRNNTNRKKKKTKKPRAGNRRRNGRNRNINRNFSAKGHVEKRTEFITDISVSNQPNFNLAFNQSVNPGLASVFPWASRIAPNYDKYAIKHLQFTYKPMVSDYALPGQQGKVIMAFDYDASDPTPTTKRAMEDTATHCDGMAYQQRTMVCLPRELHKNSNAKYVREGPVPSQASILDFDVGQIWVATEGIIQNGKIGELWVTYEVDFRVPVLETDNSTPLNRVASTCLRTNLTQNSNQSSFQFQPAIYDNPYYDGLGIGPYPTKFNLAPGIYKIDVGTHFDPQGATELEIVGVNLYYGPRDQAFGSATPLGLPVVAHYDPITVSGTIYDVNVNEIDLCKNCVWIEDGTHTLWGAFATAFDGIDGVQVHNYINIVAV